MDKTKAELLMREALQIEVEERAWTVSSSHLLEFAKLVRDDYSNKHAQLWLNRVDEAVSAEREACAKVCDEARTYISKNNAVIQSSAQDCAAAIRARSNK
jgi:hypothetical protein